MINFSNGGRGSMWEEVKVIRKLSLKKQMIFIPYFVTSKTVVNLSLFFGE